MIWQPIVKPVNGRTGRTTGVDGLKEISDLPWCQGRIPDLPVILYHCEEFIEMGISDYGTERRYELVKTRLSTAKAARISVTRKCIRP